MKSFLSQATSVLSLAALGYSAVVKQRSGPTCSDIIIPVNITANNFVIPSTLTVDNLGTFINGLGSSLFDLAANIIGGSYNIAARYCEPELYVPSRQHTVQLLVHGVTYTRN
jgi:hypothetical protein